MPLRMKGYLSLGILLTIFIISGIWYALTPEISLAEKAEATPLPTHTGNYVIVWLDKMTIELRDGTTTITTMPIVSIGKPGSYYETIGGEYINDYKEPSHFSSIGLVYMPYSIHVFGNFFIHGIPYYPNGTRVSSTFSGGCIRLTDENAKTVYDFVDNGTHVIVTKGEEYDFYPTATSSIIVHDMNMTRLMAAVISLEFLTQDDIILNIDGKSNTTRKKLLYDLIINSDDRAIKLYSKAIGEETFLNYMNKKAQTLGLTNTKWSDIQEPAITTPEDSARFMKYINDYKSYLLIGVSN